MADGDSHELHPAARRVADALGESDDPVATLAAVPGSDLTSLLLEVAQRRAASVTSADLRRRLRTDRLVEPGTVDARALHRTITRLLDALPPSFEILELSPVAPLATCSAVATVDQKKIVSTLRAAEVAADPTNTLAVIAATRAPTEARLGAVQRILRTQPFGSIGQQHFTVLGLVTAGRDRGNLDFERAALVETLGVLTAALAATVPGAIELRLTSLRDRFTDALIATARAELPETVTVVADPDRDAGRGYYRDLCFKVIVRAEGTEVEVGDGGFTDWATRLTGDRKCRMLVAGLGVDRIATVAEPVHRAQSS
jgi:hypothetical protein